MKIHLTPNLEKKAYQLRREIIKMIYKARSGHPGGSLSIAEIMTVLYFHVLRLDPKYPDWPDRDRFILSKGHACPAWYACLAMRGFFDMEVLDHLREIDSPLQGHPDMRKTPGVDMVSKALEASDILAKEGISARVIDMHTVKPIDRQAIIRAAQETKAIITIEDHSIFNGLGSRVAEVVAEEAPVPFKRIGLKDCFGESGEYEKLLVKYGLSTYHIVEAVKGLL